MTGYYSPEGKPMTLMEWAASVERMDRTVAKTSLPGGVRVSTVYLGLDHSLGEGPPLIFETMVFANDDRNGEQWRYSTLEDAKAGHKLAVEWAKNCAPA